MYLCYVDESGTAEPGGTSHFVYAGMAIPSATWKTKDDEISALKSRFLLSDSEIHCGWMIRKYVEQEKISGFRDMSSEDRRRAVQAERKRFIHAWAVSKNPRQLKEKRKNFKETEPYIHLTYDERIEFLRALADKVGSWGDCRLFGEIVKKAHFDPARSHMGGLYEEAFHQLVARFQSFLQNKGKAGRENLLGLIISDNNESVNRKLTSVMRNFHAQGTVWREIKNIVETPLFVDSKLTSMIQVVDLVSYATRRFVEHGETDLFDRVYRRFDRVYQRVVGLRHFTGNGPCTCRICVDHTRPYRDQNPRPRRGNNGRRV
ncbi:MAG: DUF3800 domain-containing protein [Calothrix sp. SM1_5_4]|nr:DUF3800 domain-containing protein [Calothrix sp. SM1_5_4]